MPITAVQEQVAAQEDFYHEQQHIVEQVPDVSAPQMVEEMGEGVVKLVP